MTAPRHNALLAGAASLTKVRASGGPARLALIGLATLALTACAATQDAGAVDAAAPGFWLGVWHGFIFPIAWIVSLFMDNVSVYAVPNNGGWYDFGYFVGIVVLGVGSRKTVVKRK